MGCALWLVDEEEKTSAWFTDGSVFHAGAPSPQIDNCSIATYFWDNPERYWWRENFTVGRVSASTHGHTFSWKKKWTDVWLFTVSWPIDNAVVGWSGLGRRMMGKMLRMTSEEEEGAEIPANGQTMWRYLNVHWKVTSAEKVFNNQVCSMTHSVDGQFLSHAIPVIAQWAHERKWTRWQRWGLCSRLYHMEFHSPRQTWPQLLLKANLPIAETSTEPHIWHHSLCDQPATWWQVDYIGSLPSWKEQCFVLAGVDTYSSCGFSFPACNTSAKITIHGLIESTVMVFYTV